MRLLFICKLSLTFSLLVLLANCGKNKSKDVEIPSTILSQEKFTKVLTDFALAESVTNLNIKNVPQNKFDSVYAFDPLKENKITIAQFDSAVAFYIKHEDLYKKIYENVLVALAELKAKRDTITSPSDSR